MLKVIARIGDFRGRDGSPFWGWLRQIAVNEALMHLRRGRRQAGELPVDGHEPADEQALPPPAAADAVDRKSVVEGKRVSVRVDLGGRRIIKKKKRQQQQARN